MSNSTSKSLPLIKAMAKSNNLHEQHVKALMREVTNAMSEWVAAGEAVTIRGFGSLNRVIVNGSFCINSINKASRQTTVKVRLNYKPSKALILADGDHNDD